MNLITKKTEMISIEMIEIMKWQVYVRMTLLSKTVLISIRDICIDIIISHCPNKAKFFSLTLI